ncbi:efflux RND transporter periplasmic adaptor subunit [Thiohalobacter thiocyanaticus]|uniref:biotin/lipoyl-binding protein n=1 Tax=Thiohalobacter thiocyanaticus TaxID=585455 RepID=UPI001F4D8971|nr:biotin/lipoyl-binding protein [Thiohalobacter thiocyanaticus]
MRTLFILALSVVAQGALAQLPTAPVERSTVPYRQWFDGEIEAVHQATVSAETSGRIAAIHFDVDDYVERDAVIVELRDTEQQARLRQAEAAVEEARARFVEARDEYNRIKEIYARKLGGQGGDGPCHFRVQLGPRTAGKRPRRAGIGAGAARIYPHPRPL